MTTASTEQTILDAARDELIAHGVRRTTVAEIARRSGVSRQTLYRYWPDAQALFGALVTRELVAVLPRATAATSLDDFVAEIVAAAGVIRGMPLLARLRESDPELLARYLVQRLGTSQRLVHGELTRRIAAGQRAGFVRGGPPERLAATVLLLAQSAVLSGPLVVEWLDDAAWTAELTELLRAHLAKR